MVILIYCKPVNPLKNLGSGLRSNKHQRINNELLDEKRIGIVQKRDVFNQSGEISHMISPNPGFEPLAEVEKIAFKIKRLINE